VPYLAVHEIIPCFSVYFSSQNPNKHTERSAEPLPVHSKSNIREKPAFASVVWNYVYINQRLTSDLSITRWFRLAHQFLWRGVLTDLTIESGSFWFEAEIDCVLSMTEWSVSNVATRILIRMCKFRTANETLPPLRVFVSRNAAWETDITESVRGDCRCSARPHLINRQVLVLPLLSQRLKPLLCA